MLMLLLPSACHCVVQQRDMEARQRDEERTAKRKEVLSMLEQQQSTFNQMVAQGYVRGGGSKAKTKADRRRRKKG